MVSMTVRMAQTKRTAPGSAINQGSSSVWMEADAFKRNITATGLGSAPMGLMSWAAGGLLRNVRCTVTMGLAVSLRVGDAMGSQTVWTEEMSKGVLMKNAAPLNFNVRMVNAYLLLCIVMGTETAWTTRMRKAALLPGPSGAQKGR